MKKIEALAKILGTRKIAYTTDYREALFCNNGDRVEQARSQGKPSGSGSIYSSGESIDTNKWLLGNGWEVTEEEYKNLYEFPPIKKYKELTVRDAARLLTSGIRRIDVEFSIGMGWHEGVLTGVDIYEGYFLENNIVWDRCRIEVKD